MPKSRLLKLLILALVIVLSCLLGTKTYYVLNDPFRVYEGGWQGDGAIYINDKKIDSSAFLLIKGGEIRLSIHNQYKEFSYTYDGTLVMRQREHISAHFDIENRHVEGLEAFIENTKLDVPIGGTLLRLNTWRLDEGRIFLDVQQSNGIDVSYILTRKSDG
ncbi:hypothetical protein [Vibrio sp. DNB22_19_1]